jgi:hypothetical protein
MKQIFGALLGIPVGSLTIANACLMAGGLIVSEYGLRESGGRYPFPLLLIGGALLAYGPYYCVTRREALFRNDPGGRKSRNAWYGLGYLWFLLFLCVDIDLLYRWTHL